MFINYRLLNSSKGTAKVTYQELNEFTFEYPCDSNHDCTPYVAEIQAGRYIFEVWGAQGGQNGGLGGYAKGTISLKATTTAYINIGGQGSSNTGNTNYGGYNGGGTGTRNFRDCTKEYTYFLSTGGGATDIRLRQDSLNHRVIVAGGGGGILYGYYYYYENNGDDGGISYEHYYNYENKGDGGGIKGGDGESEYSSVPGHGGNQTSPGLLECELESKCLSENEYIQAGFGNGGASNDQTHFPTVGGGGGWFGGSASFFYVNCEKYIKPDFETRFIPKQSPVDMEYPELAAGGGSGYVLSSTSHKPDYYIYSEDDYMSDTNLAKGLQEGNGKAKITLLELFEEEEIKESPCHNYIQQRFSIRKR